jgi:glycosyltransferase involved in cell wall biosynthesis
MRVGSRKLSEFLPHPLRPLAQRPGLERQRAGHGIREALLNARLLTGGAITHVHGPRDCKLCEDELVVLCLVRNGAAWIPTFVRHYRQLGARHIIFLDNDSTDETVELAKSHQDVSVFHTALSFAKYRVVLKRWLVRRFGRVGWCLVADVDELFNYPFSGRLGLGPFLRYLNRRGYTAVTAQMLDMFSAEPLAAVQGRAEEDLREIYRFYDVSDITKSRERYWLRMNQMDADTLLMHDGGIRARAFGWQWSNLTKHPLMRSDSNLGVFPYDEHFVTGASLADVTGVLFHYKFTSAFYRQVQEEKDREQHYGKATIYKRYDKILRENPELCLHFATARELRHAEDLLESGFLVASEEYRAWVAEHGSRTAALPQPSADRG